MERPVRLLVVEDDPLVAKAIERIGSTRGYEVELATDAAAGLELLRRARPPDLAVVDLQLPGRGDGRDLLGVYGRAGIPIVVFTGVEDEYTLALCKDYGAVAVCSKTQATARLFDVLDRVRATVSNRAAAALGNGPAHGT